MHGRVGNGTRPPPPPGLDIKCLFRDAVVTTWQVAVRGVLA